MSKKRQCIFLSESNAVLPLPPIIPPLTSPFSFELLNATTVNLATIDACVRDDDDVVALSAVINWSATFIPPASISTISILNTPGYADVTFEFLRNGVVIYRVTQTAAQKAIPLNQPTVIFTSAIPTYEIASMLFFDRIPICDSRHRKHSIYTVRATNIALVAPQVLVTGGASTTAEVGAITFVVKILNR